MIVLEMIQNEAGKIGYLKNPSEDLIEIGSKVLLVDEEVTVKSPAKIHQYLNQKFKVWILERDNGGYTPITELLTKDQQDAVQLH